MAFKTINRKIDHIVYGVHDLDKAMDDFHEKLGVRPVFGGYHSSQGTKNALINLSNGCYFELLSVDPTNTAVNSNRWMGIDLLTTSKLIRWAVKSDSLIEDAQVLKEFDPNMGLITGGSRNTASGGLLKWELIMPLSTPEVEVIPFMLDWSSSETHPSQELPDMHCELVELVAEHPVPKSYKEVLSAMQCEIKVNHGSEVRLKATIKCPNGIVNI